MIDRISEREINFGLMGVVERESFRLAEEECDLIARAIHHTPKQHKRVEYVAELVRGNYDFFAEALELSGESAAPGTIYDRISVTLAFLDSEALFEKNPFYAVPANKEPDDSVRLGLAEKLWARPLSGTMLKETKHLLTEKGKILLNEYRGILGLDTLPLEAEVESADTSLGDRTSSLGDRTSDGAGNFPHYSED